MQVSELIAQAMRVRKIASMRKLALEMKVSHAIISRWVSGERSPGFEHIAELAEMAGLPATKTAAAVRMETPEGKKHSRILRKIASAAAIFLAVYTSTSPLPAHAGVIGHNIDTVCIVTVFAMLAWFLIGWRAPPGPGSMLRTKPA